MKFHSKSLHDLDQIVSQILCSCNQSKIFTFTGNLGAGKTTLIKKICENLGYFKDITSPTFSIINEYKESNLTIYHMDLYRLKDQNELFEIGFEDYLFSGFYNFIEWPQVANNMMDVPHYAVSITYDPISEIRDIDIDFINVFNNKQ
jgi:tRNA threonylcarbamoyladenosine biosynthesis protein TsaE